jgi:hypothetical protein
VSTKQRATARTRARLRAVTLATTIASVAAAACGSDAVETPRDGGRDAPVASDAGPPPDWPFAETPASELLETGLRRDVFLVPGAIAAPNPVTGGATPSALDATQVARYREDATPPRPARAIVVAYPGTFGGAGSYDALARALVRRGAASGETTEVWAIDRRSNLLEDLRGMSTARASGDPEIAQGYYRRRHTIDGAPFAGFLEQSEVDFMSEWGLATLIEDLRRVIALVPEAARRGHVFLMGHSAGAGVVESYAAWRFGDAASAVRGAEELAGVILIDGASAAEAITEAEYHDGLSTPFGPVVGLDALRTEGPRYSEVPLLGVAVLASAEIMSMRALVDPEAVVVDPERDLLLATLFTISTGALPRLTNRAALGFGFDEASNGIPIFACSLGAPTGGAIATKEGLFGPIAYPSDPDATYDWIDALAATPPEHTPIESFARSWAAGRTNYADWYYPSRLPLDQAAVGPNAIGESSWQAASGLRAFDGPRMDAPLLAVEAALSAATGYEEVRARIAATIGPGRPHAGGTRGAPGDSTPGFRVIDASELTHLDALAAADGASPIPAGIESFLVEHAAPGTVAIDAR